MLHDKKRPQLCYSCEQLISHDASKCRNCGAFFPGLFGYSSTVKRIKANFVFVPFVTFACITNYIFSLILDPWEITSQAGFDFLSPSSHSLFILGATGAAPVFCWGRWWTVLSSGWLHGGFIHIAFNLMWIRQLSTTMTRAYGGARLTIIYIISTITSSLLSSWVGYALHLPSFIQGSQLSIGASGGVFGLFGAMVAYGQHTGSYSTKQQAIQYAGIGFLLGFFWGNVDHWAHIGGFIGGYVITQLPWLDSRYAQKNSHVFLAITCLLLVIASIAASMLHSMAFDSDTLLRICKRS